MYAECNEGATKGCICIAVCYKRLGFHKGMWTGFHKVVWGVLPSSVCRMPQWSMRGVSQNVVWRVPQMFVCRVPQWLSSSSNKLNKVLQRDPKYLHKKLDTRYGKASKANVIIRIILSLSYYEWLEKLWIWIRNKFHYIHSHQHYLPLNSQLKKRST